MAKVTRMRVWVLVLYFVLHQKRTVSEDMRWDLMHQNEYDVIPHHIETKWVNTSYVKLEQVAYVRYNRTYPRVLNATWFMLSEVDAEKFYVHVRVYKFVSNTYKPFPVNVNINICKEYHRNSCNARDIATKFTNIRSCPLLLGRYSCIHLRVDYSKFPPHMPHGEFKTEFHFYNGEDKMAHFEIFDEVVGIKSIQ